jgi:hypothetical protein
MTDAFTVLAQDGEEVKAMLAELEKRPVLADQADSDQLALRKKMTEQFQALLRTNVRPASDLRS